MARVKQSVMQRDFSLMELRADLLDADGDEMRARSLKGALNMRSMTTRIAQARPGTYFMRNVADVKSMTEIRPADGLVYAVLVRPQGLTIIDREGRAVRSFNDLPWDGEGVWVVPARERTFFGHATAGMFILTYDEGSWSIAPWSFMTAEGGEAAQPYWSFKRNVSLQASGRGGLITLTASEPVFTPEHVGQRIRYSYREIEVRSYIGPRSVTGQVIGGALPPSFEVRVQRPGEFRAGQVLVASDTDWQGMLVQVTVDGRLLVATLRNFQGPDVDETITSPTGTSKVMSKTEITPLPTTVWDEALISPVRGYPRSASMISGRLVFVDFPEIPDLIALSSARDPLDFKVGAEDDDAILRQEGDGTPRFLHAINAGDLLLLSDRGCYYVPMRDSGVLTPSSFNAVLFDQRGASPIRPVNADDGVVFVEANGETISACLLDGNIYLKWSVQPLTLFCHHLVNAPVALCGPAVSAKEAEKYIFVVNGDGSMAAMSWSMKIGDEAVGFSPWVTEGQFRAAAPMFGGYWVLVDRGGLMIERFDYDAYVDSAAASGSAATNLPLEVGDDVLEVNGQTLMVTRAGAAHLAGREVAVLDGSAYAGMFTLDADGSLEDAEISPSAAQIGLPFGAVAEFWPVELIESPRIGMITARVIRLSVSVLDSTAFQIATNNTVLEVGGFEAGEALGAPPSLKTRVYRASVFGRRHHPYLAAIKHLPGPFRILAVGQEVQG